MRKWLFLLIFVCRGGRTEQAAAQLNECLLDSAMLAGASGSGGVKHIATTCCMLHATLHVTPHVVDCKYMRQPHSDSKEEQSAG